MNRKSSNGFFEQKEQRQMRGKLNFFSCSIRNSPSKFEQENIRKNEIKLKKSSSEQNTFPMKTNVRPYNFRTRTHDISPLKYFFVNINFSLRPSNIFRFRFCSSRRLSRESSLHRSAEMRHETVSGCVSQ